MKYQKYTLVLAGLMMTQMSHARNDSMDDVRFFSHFFEDAAVVTNTHVEPALVYANFENGDVLSLGANAGMPVKPNLDVGLNWAFASVDPDGGKSESGLTDPTFYGRYHLDTQYDANVTVGGSVSLPIGKKEVGGDRFNFGAFAAARYPLGNGIVAMASVGLNSVEIGNDRELSLHLGGGGIYEVSSEIHLLAEVALDTEEDIFDLTGGVDYVLSHNMRARGALVVGIDDGSPDFALSGSVLFTF